jgi:hypothetical protein
VKSRLSEHVEAKAGIDGDGQPLKTPPLELPAIVDAAEFCGSEITLPCELVCGLAHQGSKIEIGGGSKTCKTWNLIDLGLSLAYGERWLGFETNQGKVLIVDLEIQRAFHQRRIVAVARAKNIILTPGRMDVWSLRGYCASYVDLFPRIIKRTKDGGYVLIILDPIYKVYGQTDENSAGEVASLMNGIEELTVQTRAAVAFSCHFAKGNAAGKESIDRISGSGVFARDPDVILNFTRHEEKDAFTVEATLRNSPPIDPFVVRWQYPLMHRDNTLDPARLKQVGRGKGHDPLVLLTAIKKTTAKAPVSVTSWAQLAAVPRATLYQYLRDMRAKNWIKTAGEGNTARQYITPAGRLALKERTA